MGIGTATGRVARSALGRLLRQLRRVVAILVLLQVAGVGHMAEDVLVLGGAVQCHESDCGNEPDRCPPGCPNCHCPARLNVVVPSASGALASLTEPEPEQICVYFQRERRPENPFQASLYRPPRQS